jgi:hypothetical protein
MSEIFPESPPVQAEPWRAAWLAFTDAAGFTRVPPSADACLDPEWIAAWTAAAKAGATAEVRVLRGTLALRDAEIEMLRARLDGHAAPAEPVRYALVEQMGRRATTAAVREITFCGEPMLEVTSMAGGGSVHVVSPKSLYEVTWLTEEQARQRAKPWTATAITTGSGRDEDQDDDDIDEDDQDADPAEDVDSADAGAGTHVWGDDE